jgi:hypothetical protein
MDTAPKSAPAAPRTGRPDRPCRLPFRSPPAARAAGAAGRSAVAAAAAARGVQRRAIAAGQPAAQRRARGHRHRSRLLHAAVRIRRAAPRPRALRAAVPAALAPGARARAAQRSARHRHAAGAAHGACGAPRHPQDEGQPAHAPVHDRAGQELQVGCYEPAHHVVEAVAPGWPSARRRRTGPSSRRTAACAAKTGQLLFGPGVPTCIELPASTRRQPTGWRCTTACSARTTALRRPCLTSRTAGWIQSLDQLKAATMACRECPIGEFATQSVIGEGKLKPRLMLVGEQPGDQEDLRAIPSSARPASCWRARWKPRAFRASRPSSPTR